MAGEGNRGWSRRFLFDWEEGRRINLFRQNSLGALWSSRGQTNGCLPPIDAGSVRARSCRIVRARTVPRPATPSPGESVQGFRNEQPDCDYVRDEKSLAP